MLWRTTLAWQRRIRIALASFELTHVQFVLLASLWWLSEHGDEHPIQSHLAQQAGTDLMMTSQVTRKLEDRGLIERRPISNDRRAWALHLTPAGSETVAGALRAVEDSDAEFFAPLGERERAFVSALSALSA